MNPFLNEIFHILYPIYCKTESNEKNINTSSPSSSSSPFTMDGYLYYIFGIVVRDLRLYSKSSIGDIIHEMKEINNQFVPIIPNAYDLLFKSVELAPYNWSVIIILLFCCY